MIFHFFILFIVLKPLPVGVFLVIGRFLLVLGRCLGTASLSEVSPWRGWHQGLHGLAMDTGLVPGESELTLAAMGVSQGAGQSQQLCLHFGFWFEQKLP